MGITGKLANAVISSAESRDDCRIVGGTSRKSITVNNLPVKSQLSDLPEFDIVIDCSNPDNLDKLLEYCLSTGTPVVIATTGFSDEQIAKIKAAAEQIPVFFSFNMSLGINLLASLAKTAAKLLGGQFDIEIV